MEQEPRPTREFLDMFWEDYFVVPFDEFEGLFPQEKKTMVVALLCSGDFTANQELYRYADMIARRLCTSDAFVNHFYKLYLNYLSGEGGEMLESLNFPSPEEPFVQLHPRPVVNQMVVNNENQAPPARPVNDENQAPIVKFVDVRFQVDKSKARALSFGFR